MVTRLDSDVGQILEFLREEGLDKNTLVMFSGDNGSSFNPSSAIGKRFDQTMGGKLREFNRGMYEGAAPGGDGMVAGHRADRVTEEP
jgi:arylsulfatase A-like enzyme